MLQLKHLSSQDMVQSDVSLWADGNKNLISANQLINKSNKQSMLKSSQPLLSFVTVMQTGIKNRLFLCVVIYSKRVRKAHLYNSLHMGTAMISWSVVCVMGGSNDYSSSPAGSPERLVSAPHPSALLPVPGWRHIHVTLNVLFQTLPCSKCHAWMKDIFISGEEHAQTVLGLQYSTHTILHPHKYSSSNGMSNETWE